MTLQDAIDMLGIRVPRSKQLMCPTGHDKASPSFMLYPETDSFYCFGCGRSGDAYGLIALWTDKPIAQVLREYSDGFGPAVGTKGMNVQQVRDAVLRMLIMGTQPVYDAIRADSSLEVWQKDLLIDRFDEQFLEWWSGFEEDAPRKLQQRLQAELPGGVRVWMRRNGVGDGEARRKAEEACRLAVS